MGLRCQVGLAARGCTVVVRGDTVVGSKRLALVTMMGDKILKSGETCWKYSLTLWSGRRWRVDWLLLRPPPPLGLCRHWLASAVVLRCVDSGLCAIYAGNIRVLVYFSRATRPWPVPTPSMARDLPALGDTAPESWFDGGAVGQRCGVRLVPGAAYGRG
jgi:hypothetical protein